MRLLRLVSAIAALLMVGAVTVPVSSQGPARLPLPLEPFGEAGEAVFPAFEGWGDAQDGSGYFIVLGYRNRNRTQRVEVPIGPNNRIEPDGPDYGQPTVFEPGRQETVFAIKVPRDFGTKKLTWTLVANGQQAVVTFHLNPHYKMAFYREDANGNAPPRMKLGPSDPLFSGPTAGVLQTLNGTVGTPVPLRLWASDAPPTEKNWESIVSAQNRPKPQALPRDQVAVIDGRVIGSGAPPRVPSATSTVPDITVVWKKVRGPGAVTITPPSVGLTTRGDSTVIVEATAAATFSAPGEYMLRAEPIEADDGFDGLCCFTFAHIRVVVR